MELPKNITQIGEADRRLKIYVEDYVISYIRQMNHVAENKTVGLALYGVRKQEGDISYLFFYGACKLDTLQREVRHLSQAQNQEIEKLRKQFFSEYQFLGYRMLNGEMVEGFHVYEQGICRYITGYACFYEKNDAMLAYMLDSRGEEAQPEQVDQEKYERVRKRQETRKQEYQIKTRQGNKTREYQRTTTEEDDKGKIVEKNTPRRAQGSTMRMMRLSVAGVFLLLCVVGLAAINDNGGIGGLQNAIEQMMAEFKTQRLPDSDDVISAMNPNANKQDGVLYTENNLADAIQKENDAQSSNAETESQGLGQSTESTQPEGTQMSEGQKETEHQSDEQETGEQAPDEQQSGEQETGEQQNTEETEGDEQDTQLAQNEPEEAVPTVNYTSYIIQRGDTLSGISVKYYGTDKRVREICEINRIDNPDDIYFGQKILLP